MISRLSRKRGEEGGTVNVKNNVHTPMVFIL